MLVGSKAYDYAHYTPASYEQWQKSQHKQSVQLTNTLESGTWNPVEVDLAPASSRIGYLNPSHGHKSVLFQQVPAN